MFACDAPHHATLWTGDLTVTEAAITAGAGGAASIDALDGERAAWRYTEFPDTQCRDGSASGVGINLGSTPKVLIYLEGGNLCFNDQTCDFSPSSADVSGLGNTVGVAGQFDRSRVENPFRDWSFVYIPYCTGDLHAGNNPDAMVPNVGPQKFMGYANMKKFLARVVPTFSGATDVVVSGSSAGGWGALFNTLLVQRAFPGVKVKMLDDSGPPLSKALLAPCLQDRLRTLWKLDETILADCGSACPNPHDYIQDYAVFLAKTLSDRPLALISSAEDFGQRSALAVAKNDCTGSMVAALIGGLLDVGDGVSASDWRTDLLALRNRMKPYANFNTFYPESTLHTWISGYSAPGIMGDFYEAEVGGVKLTDWLARFAEDENPGHTP